MGCRVQGVGCGMAGGEREDGGGLQGVLERVGCEYTDPLRSSRLGSDSASRCRLRVQGLVWWGGLSQYRHPHEQPFCKRNAAHSRHGVGHFRPRLVALRLRGRICTRTHAVRGGGAVLVSVKATVCGDSGGARAGLGFGSHRLRATVMQERCSGMLRTWVRRCRNAASRAPKSPRSET